MATQSGTDWAAEYLRQHLADGAACLAAALEYLARGWPVLALCPPDHAGIGRVNKGHTRKCTMPGKVPWHTWKEYQTELPTETTVRDWWRQLPTSNTGMALGKLSGLVRVDPDGPAGEAKLQQLSGGDLPPTLEFRRGTNRGLLYRIPDGVEFRTTYESPKPGEELRFQGEGAQTVLPPSRHASGDRYEWVLGHGPGEIEAAVAPDWLVRELRAGNTGKSGGKRAKPLAPGEKIHERTRNSRLTSLGGAMRRHGFDEEAIAAALLVTNEMCCEPPLPEDEVRGIAHSVARYEPDPAAGVTLILPGKGPVRARRRAQQKNRSIQFVVRIEA